MSSFSVISSVSGSEIWFGADGDGSSGNPLVPYRILQVGANLVSSSHPLPVQIALPPDGFTFVEAQLAASGSQTPGRNVAGAKDLMFLIDAGLASGGSATVVPEYSHNGTKWYPIGEPYKIDESVVDENGHDTISFNFTRPLRWVRLNWKAEEGTGSTLDIVVVAD